MPYQSNIPQATDILAVSQSDILNNFSTLDTWCNVDHGGFNAVVGIQGTHLKVSNPVQGAAPVFPTPRTTNGFYTLTNATTTLSETYIHKQNQAASIDIPMTASILGQVNNPAVNTTGWSYLPSGILLKWGTATTINGALAVNVNAGGIYGPNYTTVMNAQVTQTNIASTGNVTVAAGVPNITISATAASAGFLVSWFTIGY